MKPRIFIGSSTERLEIAYFIQENLEYDALTTVWTQGIFKLSTNTLDSLINSLNDFDFAIFVFHPDDITQIRNNSYETIRDNLIFELGLFIGKLGKEKVFFLIPRTINSLHLPTDLLGIVPGTYDNQREDENIKASLGPFCNQVRTIIKKFVYENIEDIQDEPDSIKKIVLDKPDGWEYLFAADLLEKRLIIINKNYEEIEKGIVIQKLKSLTGEEFFDWYQNTLANFQNFINLFKVCFEDLVKSFGEPGVSGKPIEIKNAVDRIVLLCKELLNWEYELNSINLPNDLMTTKTKMKWATKTMFIDEINKFLSDLRKLIQKINSTSDGVINEKLKLSPQIPYSFETIVDDFRNYFGLR